MNEIVKGFYAYPSQYPPVVYPIQNAIHHINNAGYKFRVKDWQSMAVAGKFILDEVCAEIDDSDVFICDLTQINMNVLFELGYAIAQNKRIWISLNEQTHDKEKLYEGVGLLTTIGYRTYTNEHDLTSVFFQDEPFNDLQNTIYNRKIKSQERYSKTPKLFYLRAGLPTTELSDLTRFLLKSGLPLFDDDPTDTNNRPLEEYINTLYNSFGVVAHFLSEKQDAKNAKHALICGMAYGFGTKPLMLAHAPYVPAVDYRDLMFVHENTKQCIEHTEIWLLDIRSKYERFTKRHNEFQRRMKATQALQKIDLGEYEAEWEKDQLSKYFVRTSAFNEALKTSQYMIYVGRKGSGKTANFYRIAQELRDSQDQRNYVCVIKPVYYELEGVFQLFNLSLAKADKGYLVESLWKYLIYTELAFDSYKNLSGKPSALLSQEEKDLIHYMDHFDFLRSDFTVRLEHAIRDLCRIEVADTVSHQRQKVSEILHNTIISQLRILLGNVLAEHDRVMILIDNLDKAWQRRDDLNTMSEFLFGLLKVGERISAEFQQSDSRKRKVELVILVFIRGDIFSYIAPNAREKDKLKSTHINWNDPSVLLRVIEERFRNSLTGSESSDEIWGTYFPTEVNGVSTKQYLVSRILPRPRDMIFLCKQALFHAINHEHPSIEETDLLQAEQDYSYHSWLTLLAETETQFPGIETLLDLFTKEPEILTREQFETLVQEASISRRKVDELVELLCEAGFLGLECDLNEFVFVYNDRLKQRRTQAKKVAKQTGIERYRVNFPFHSYLETKPCNLDGSLL